MSIFVKLSIDPLEIAAHLASRDAEEQAKFFETFIGELFLECQTHYRTEVQLAAVAERLSKNAWSYLGMLAPEPTK